MGPDKPTDLEQQWAEQLARVDEALRQGRNPDAPEETVEDASSGNLESHVELLKALHHRWPRPASQVDTSLGASTGRDTPPGDRPDALAGAGERLGRFEIREQLGHGGYGAVFLAFDPQLERLVALKIPQRAPLCDPTLSERFRQEARAAAGLDHPHIVTVYEAGEIGPIVYIASAYCPGTTLAHWLRHRDKPVPFRDGAALIADLAEAVDHAHGRGVLHRDLKPANVLLSPRSPVSATSAGCDDQALGKFTPRITDFGLAKLVDQERGHTHSGDILGTPNYMAPEQARGKSRAVGPAADVYALGVMLYELVTGRPPFVGDNHLEVLIQSRSAEPVAASRLRPGTPRDLETICRKCLEKEPARRYSGAGALAADLRRYLAGRPIEARPTGWIVRSLRWSRRQPLVAALLLSLIVAVTGGITGVVAQWRRAESKAEAALLAEGQANIARLAAERERNAADAARDTAVKEQIRARSSLAVTLRAIDMFCTRVSESPALLRGTPGAQQLRLDLLRDARAFYEELLEHNQGPELHFEMATAWSRLGSLLATLGEPDESAAALRQAIAILESLLAADEQRDSYVFELARAKRGLGTALLESNRHADALAMFADAESLHARLTDPTQADLDHQRELAVVKHGIAMVYAETERRAEAISLGGEALALLDEVTAASPDKLVPLRLAAYLRLHLGHFLMDLDREAEAERMYRDALRDVRQLEELDGAGPNERFLSVQVWNSLGLLAVRRAEYDAASKAYRHGIQEGEALRADNPDVVFFAIELAGLYSNRGRLQRATNQLEAAEADYRTAIEMLRPMLRLRSLPRQARMYFVNANLKLAALLRTTERVPEAETVYQELVDLLEPLVEVDQPALALQSQCGYSLFGLGAAQLHGGKWEQALDSLRRAVELHDRVGALQPEMSEYPAMVIEGLASAARALCRLRRVGEARAHLQRAEENLRDLTRRFPDHPRLAELAEYIAEGRLELDEGGPEPAAPPLPNGGI